MLAPGARFSAAARLRPGAQGCAKRASRLASSSGLAYSERVTNDSGRRVVLVTGAARRLGRDILLDLARHGFDVAIHFRHSADDAVRTRGDAQALGARAEVFSADLADEAAARALVPAVATVFGRIDAVVNSASLFEYDDVASFTYASLERHFRSNTAPSIVLAQALSKHLEGSARQGCVVNVLDQKLWNPNPDYLSYTLSKAGLEAATTLLAQALAPRVRVCGVAPGVTLPSGPMTSNEFEQAHLMTPLGRSSEPRDVAHAVRFLLDSRAVTGTTLLVDGGQHLAKSGRDVMFQLGERKSE